MLVRDVVIPATGNRFVSAGNDGALLVWDLDSGKVVDRLIGKAGVIMCLAVSPDGSHILAGGYKKVLCLWDLAASQLTPPPASRQCYSCLRRLFLLTSVAH